MTLIKFAAAAVAVGALMGTAQAQGVVASSGNVYVGVAAGVVMPEDVDFTANATQGGATASAAGKFEFDNGYSASGYAGYNFNQYLAAEVELGYTQFDYDKVVGTMTITSGGSTINVAGSADIDGQVESWIGLARGVVTPLGKGKFSPLFGVGVGFAATEEQITRVMGTAVNASNDHTDLALEGMVGVQVEMTPNVDIGARYRYMWIDSGSEGVDDFTAHNILATASFRF